jgi:hypothetical protein
MLGGKKRLDDSGREDLHEMLKQVRRSDRWGEETGVKTQAQQRYATGIVMADARCLWKGTM